MDERDSMHEWNEMDEKRIFKMKTTKIHSNKDEDENEK